MFLYEHGFLIKKGMAVMAILKMFKKSAQELKSLRCITVTGVLIALDLALKTVTINLEASLKISFAFIALAAIGMLFGPTVSLLAGIITDVLGFFMYPQTGAFNPFFTLIEAVGAMLYGLFLYNLVYVRFDKDIFKAEGKSKIGKALLFLKKMGRIILAKVSVVIVCNLIMTPIANVIFGYQTVETAIVKYPARLLKNLIQCPVDCALLIIVLFPILAAYKSVFKIGSAKEAAN